MKNGQNKKGIAPLKKYYPESFKIRVVREVENGLLSKEAAKRKYGIRGKSAVLYWCRKYGQEGYPIMVQKIGKKPLTPDEKDQRIAELEAQLTHSKITIDTLESLIEVANEMYGTDLKKKVGIKRSKR
jgi:transposase-like protein